MRVLITGGTGSLGQALIQTAPPEVEHIVVVSRDEFKQHEMRRRFAHLQRLEWIIADVRDQSRIRQVLGIEGIHAVIHAAAMKQVPACEDDPWEAYRTNVVGAENVLVAAIETGVARVLFVSTDKAVYPTSVYGATKLIAERMFCRANRITRETRFLVVRLGNLIGSRGSVLPLFMEQAVQGRLTVTDPRMTRFWCTPQEAAGFIWEVLSMGKGGEIFIPRLPSFRIVDLARVIAPEAEIVFTGVRPGERLAELLIAPEESSCAFQLDAMWILVPPIGGGQPPPGARPVREGFCYASDTNDWWLDQEAIAARLRSFRLMLPMAA